MQLIFKRYRIMLLEIVSNEKSDKSQLYYNQYIIITSSRMAFDFYNSLKENSIFFPFIVVNCNNVISMLSVIDLNSDKIVFVDARENTDHQIMDFLHFFKKNGIQSILLSNYNTSYIPQEEFNTTEFHKLPSNTDDLISILDNSKLSETLYTKINKQHIVSSETFYSKFIAVPHLNSIQLLQKQDIVHLNSNGKYTLFHLKNKQVIVSSKNLGEYEKELFSDLNFIRVHHSHIINLDYLSIIDKEQGWCCVMSDGELIKISRTRKDDIYARLNLRPVIA